MKLICVALTAVWLANATAQYNDHWSKYEALLHQYQTDPNLKQQWMDHTRQFVNANTANVMSETKTSQASFKCEASKSKEAPASVNRLLPGDIKVVGALGDSITAGNGILASTPIGVLYQDRGHSYSIGGYESYEEGIITLPNILKQYSLDLYGYSTDGGTVDEDVSKFNLAEPGMTSPDMPLQATRLVERMQQDPKVNYDLDWKMVTLFVGGNDLCWVCEDEADLNSEAYLENVKATLDELSVRMRRTIVNVVPIMDITPLVTISDGAICDAIQGTICPCGTDPNKREKIQHIQREYSSKVSELIDTRLYDREDFTVVFQPFLRDTKPPTLPDGKPDRSFFAPDCFHFSENGHKALAKNLFNSLFQPIGKKATSINFREEVKCPAKGMFIQTRENMNQTLAHPEMLSDPAQPLAVKPRTTVPSGNRATLLIVSGLVGGVCAVLALVGLIMTVNATRKRARVHDVVA